MLKQPCLRQRILFVLLLAFASPFIEIFAVYENIQSPKHVRTMPTHIFHTYYAMRSVYGLFETCERAKERRSDRKAKEGEPEAIESTILHLEIWLWLWLFYKVCLA